MNLKAPAAAGPRPGGPACAHPPGRVPLRGSQPAECDRVSLMMGYPRGAKADPVHRSAMQTAFDTCSNPHGRPSRRIDRGTQLRKTIEQETPSIPRPGMARRLHLLLACLLLPLPRQRRSELFVKPKQMLKPPALIRERLAAITALISIKIFYQIAFLTVFATYFVFAFHIPIQSIHASPSLVIAWLSFYRV